jgi:Protein of unknown function (DUF1552)
MERSMSRTRISRRSVLSTFSGLAAAGYFKGLLRDAFAGETPAAPRFIVLWNPNGCALDLWRPRATNGGAAAETGWVLDYDPDSSLGPLEPHKDSLLIIEGLDLTCNYQDLDPMLTGHDGARVAPLTGRHARSQNDQNRTDGPSLDHVVAKQLATKPFYFKPLGFSLNPTAVSYDDAGEQIPYEYDLRQSFRNWFGAVASPGNDPALAAADSAVVAYLQSDARRLRSRLAGQERLKMDAHLDALHVLEQRLKQTTTTSCGTPVVPLTSLGDEDYFRTVVDFGLQLFTCGLTQCMSLVLDVGQTMPWVGLGDLQMHDDVAHGYRPADPTTVRQLSKLQRWYAAQVAYLIQGLKSIPEGAGTAYDNTIILWASEFGDPARHMNSHLPFIVAGGAGAHKKGRFLQLGTAAEYNDPQHPHNGLLASIANQYGIGLTGFGDPRFPGELSGFLG